MDGGDEETNPDDVGRELRNTHRPVPSQVNKLYLTNNYSIVSKYSASKVGYFRDKLLEKFIEIHCPDDIKRRRTPLVNRGYAARMLAIEWAVVRAIKNDHMNCFIVLGSGYDMLPQRYLGQCHWIEIDLPEVIKTKSDFIKHNWNQTSENECFISDGIISFPQLYLNLISCDLSMYDELKSKLTRVLEPIKHECRRITILNEVCLCYSSKERIDKILQTICNLVCDYCWQLHYIGYEQVQFSENNQFSKFILKHFESLGHPLKYFPNQQQVREFFEQNSKFNHVTVASMFQIYHNALLSETLESKINELEPFDEYEAMDLYLSHYALVTGVRIFKSPFMLDTEKPHYSSSDLVDLIREVKLNDKTTTSIDIRPEQFVRKFGHAGCALNEQQVLIFGGFGLDRKLNHHIRLSDCLILDATGNGSCIELDTSTFNKQSARLDRMHGQVCYLGNGKIFISGGRQSPTRSSLVSFNCPVVCNVDKCLNKLTIDDHLFTRNQEQFQELIRWRHKLIRTSLGDNSVIQIGGLSVGASGHHDQLRLFNLDSDKLGVYNLVPNDTTNLDCFKRHSFGADRCDNNTFLLFGGLRSTECMFKDLPVELDYNVILCDTRAISNSSRPFQMKANNLAMSSYDLNVHFKNQYQFIKLGGVSVQTGLPENHVDLYDLRSNLDRPVERKMIPVNNEAVSSRVDQLMVLTNFTSFHFESAQEVTTFGGGGNYFTFGTHFNSEQIVYKY